MQVQLTQSDFERNRITKIARVIAKIVKPDLDLPHAKILLIVANILGYSSYFDAKNSSEDFKDRDDLNTGFIYFEEHYAPSTEILRESFVRAMEDYSDEQQDLNQAFGAVPFHSLDYFSDESVTSILTRDIIENTTSAYFRNMKYVFLEGIGDDDFYFIPCFRRDVYRFLQENLRLEANDLLSSVTVSQFLDQNLKVSYEEQRNGRTEVVIRAETYFDLIFKPSHDSLVNMSLRLPSRRPKLSSAEFFKLSSRLLNSFNSKYADRPLLSLFQSNNDEGFFGEFSEPGQGCKWTEIIPHKNPCNGHLQVCGIPIEKDIFSSDLGALYWKYEGFDESGEVEFFASGGLYPKFDEETYELCDFPYDDEVDDAMGSRERALTHRMTCMDNTILDDHGEFRKANENISTQLSLMNIMTVSVFEKRKGAAEGLGIKSLRNLINIIHQQYGDMAIHMYAAPMQYIDWHPRCEFELIAKLKKRDVKKLSSYLKKNLGVSLPVYIVQPKH